MSPVPSPSSPSLLHLLHSSSPSSSSSAPCSLSVFCCSARPWGMPRVFDQVFIISDCMTLGCLTLTHECGFCVDEACRDRTEQSAGIPPPLLRSSSSTTATAVLGLAASTRWNAWPPSLIALLRAISNSLSGRLTAGLYQLGDSWYVVHCEPVLDAALL